MRKTAKITSKGQITLPLEVRRRLGVKTGDSVVFDDERGTVQVAAQVKENPFEKYRGIGHPGFPSGRKNIIKFMREMRGE